MNNKYNLSFSDIVNNIFNYDIGTIIESQHGDLYVLSKVGEKIRKFSRMSSTKLRFLTYNNMKVNFRIVESDKKLNIVDINNFNYNKDLKEVVSNQNKIIEILRENGLDPNYCSECGVELDNHNKYMNGMCKECKYGINWEE